MATYTPISGITPQYSTTNNELASGYYLKFYKSGTTTPLSVATDSAGGTLLAKVKLNPLGMPISNPLDDNTIFIPHVSENYRVVLYVNEADADNNTTASAVFNIDGLAPDIAPSGDAADITLRDTNIERQDDYDRSPLFVDGTDFTAGAGPHTITVPSGWDPTNVDFRVYRLDASDIVTALTPTAETTTTFTLAETLLSTDIIYIGDDEFRNIHDGDPADIRSRLDVPTNSEALLAANNLSDVTAATARTNIDVYSTAEVDQEITDLAEGNAGAPTIKAASSDYATGTEAFSNASGDLSPVSSLGLTAGWYIVYYASAASEPEGNQQIGALFVDPNVQSCLNSLFDGSLGDIVLQYLPATSGGELRVAQRDDSGGTTDQYIYKVRKDRA